MIANRSGKPPNRAGAASLQLGGFERLSLVDWPGMLTAVVFCQGCGWGCRYCHNPHLIPFVAAPAAPAWSDIFGWLQRRRGLLDGVVFSGGEPTLQPGLAAAIGDVRELGFKVGLHTGGPIPVTFATLLPQLDWVGFDFKAPFDRYAQVTGHDHGARAQASLTYLIQSRVAFEVRTTWHPHLLAHPDLAAMARSLLEAGCADWTLQVFRREGCADAKLASIPADFRELATLAAPGLRIKVR